MLRTYYSQQQSLKWPVWSKRLPLVTGKSHLRKASSKAWLTPTLHRQVTKLQTPATFRIEGLSAVSRCGHDGDLCAGITLSPRRQLFPMDNDAVRRNVPAASSRCVNAANLHGQASLGICTCIVMNILPDPVQWRSDRHFGSIARCGRSTAWRQVLSGSNPEGAPPLCGAQLHPEPTFIMRLHRALRLPVTPESGVPSAGRRGS